MADLGVVGCILTLIAVCSQTSGLKNVNNINDINPVWVQMMDSLLTSKNQVDKLLDSPSRLKILPDSNHQLDSSSATSHSLPAVAASPDGAIVPLSKTNFFTSHKSRTAGSLFNPWPSGAEYVAQLPFTSNNNNQRFPPSVAAQTWESSRLLSTEKRLHKEDTQRVADFKPGYPELALQFLRYFPGKGVAPDAAGPQSLPTAGTPDEMSQVFSEYRAVLYNLLKSSMLARDNTFRRGLSRLPTSA